jgi:hypothetical protein
MSATLSTSMHRDPKFAYFSMPTAAQQASSSESDAEQALTAAPDADQASSATPDAEPKLDLDFVADADIFAISTVYYLREGDRPTPDAEKPIVPPHSATPAEASTDDVAEAIRGAIKRFAAPLGEHCEERTDRQEKLAGCASGRILRLLSHETPADATMRARLSLRDHVTIKELTDLVWSRCESCDVRLLAFGAVKAQMERGNIPDPTLVHALFDELMHPTRTERGRIRLRTLQSMKRDDLELFTIYYVRAVVQLAIEDVLASLKNHEMLRCVEPADVISIAKRCDTIMQRADVDVLKPWDIKLLVKPIMRLLKATSARIVAAETPGRSVIGGTTISKNLIKPTEEQLVKAVYPLAGAMDGAGAFSPERLRNIIERMTEFFSDVVWFQGQSRRKSTQQQGPAVPHTPTRCSVCGIREMELNAREANVVCSRGHVQESSATHELASNYIARTNAASSAEHLSGDTFRSPVLEVMNEFGDRLGAGTTTASDALRHSMARVNATGSSMFAKKRTQLTKIGETFFGNVERALSNNGYSLPYPDILKDAFRIIIHYRLETVKFDMVYQTCLACLCLLTKNPKLFHQDTMSARKLEEVYKAKYLTLKKQRDMYNTMLRDAPSPEVLRDALKAGGAANASVTKEAKLLEFYKQRADDWKRMGEINILICNLHPDTDPANRHWMGVDYQRAVAYHASIMHLQAEVNNETDFMVHFTDIRDNAVKRTNEHIKSLRDMMTLWGSAAAKKALAQLQIA